MNMRSNIILITTSIVLLLLIIGCKKDWDEHYNNAPETVDRNLWEDLQQEEDLSLFVNALIELEYDTLFDSDDTYTLFLPENAAFSQFLDTAEVTNGILDYHISRHFIQSGNITSMKMIQVSSCGQH